MIVVNLIPIDRQRRRQRRIRIRVWAAIVTCYTIFLAVAFIASRVVGSSTDDQVPRLLTQTRTQLTSAEVTMTALRSDIDEATARLAANREVGDQPDWSIVLALLSGATGDDIVLNRCKLYSGPDQPSPSRQDPAPSDGPVTAVEIAGLARSQQDVSNFLLRMEGAPLFREVRLNDTRREPFLDGSVIAFRADFVISSVGDSNQ